jgi:hypothetical protein
MREDAVRKANAAKTMKRTRGRFRWKMAAREGNGRLDSMRTSSASNIIGQ